MKSQGSDTLWNMRIWKCLVGGEESYLIVCVNAITKNKEKLKVKLKSNSVSWW